jgi:hypothetical protein
MIVNNIYAVRMSWGWRLVTKVDASSYGLTLPKRYGSQVWCEIGTTALIGPVGEELVAIDLLPYEPTANLPRTPLTQADADTYGDGGASD